MTLFGKQVTVDRVEHGPFRLKNFTLKEGIYVQFRAEAFNAFNNVQFNPPEMSVVSPNFARLTSALLPRVMQMALRLTF